MARSTAPTTILLVRHGTTPTTGKVLPGRAPGLHLSEQGRREAEAVATRIAAAGNVAALYASPLERARETAAPIAAATGHKMVLHRGLLECDFGAWTGARLATLAKKTEWTMVQHAPSAFRFPEGESFTDMQMRIVGALEEIRDRHPGGRVVCVSHADPIKAAVAHALGTHLDLFQRIVISPCSVSVLSWGRVGPAVLTVNSTGEALAGLRPS